jgi:hypothetical protein
MAKTPPATAKPKTPAPAEKKASKAAAQPDRTFVDAGAAHKPIPNAFRLLWRAILVLKENWKVLLGLALIYMVLNLILVQGLNAASNLSVVKESLNNFGAGGVRTHLANGVSLYAYLLGSSGTSVAPTAGAYQFILSIIFSLATIWGLRQIYAKRVIRIRETFYYGMYPFITFFLVLLMVVVHLLPFALGSILYGIISANGIATTPVEAMSFLFVFLILAMISIYLLASSIFALYIVTLPEVTPMAALRSARDLVTHRRWTIMRKVIFLPLALLVLGGIVLLPVVLWATVLAPWIFTAVAAVLLVLTHSYMYALYRSLL